MFTPRGKILSLPRGSTAVDFAYAVHTDIGNRCVACRINYEPMPLRTELRNGDQVEIISAAHANPNPAWLSYVKTGKARAQIRHFLKTMQQAESARLGERLLAKALADLNASLDTLEEASWEKMLRESGAKAREEVMTDIGLGKRLAPVVARRLLLYGEAQQAGVRAAGPVPIRGTEGMAVQLARCCQPIGAIRSSVPEEGQGLHRSHFRLPGHHQVARAGGGQVAGRGMGAGERAHV